MTANTTCFPAFTFKHCLLLCIPALIIGAILRIFLIAAIPEANFASDGNSWVSTTTKFWDSGKLRFSPKRRWLYHFLMLPVPPLPGNLPQVVAVAQHAVGMVVIVGVGWVTGHVTRHRRLTVPLATTIAAIWPSMLYSEHDVSAESLMPALFTLAVAAAFPLERLKERRSSLIFLVLAGLMASSQPRAKLLWAGMLFVVLCYLRWRPKWGIPHYAVILASIVAIVTMGEKSQGSWLLLSSSLPLVKEEGATWQDYRQELRPAIERARKQGMDYPWEQKHWKKELGGSEEESLSPEWTRLRRDPRFPKAGKDLAVEGILAHPFQFTGFVLMKNAIAASGPAVLYDFQVPRFWRRGSETHRENWRDMPRQMKVLYELDQAQFEAMVAERSQRKYIFSEVMDWISQNLIWADQVLSSTSRYPDIRPNWVTFLLFFGLIMTVVTRRLKIMAIMLVPAVIHNIVVFSVGDCLPRYLLPVEWIGWTLVVIGLDAAWEFVRRLTGRGATSPPAAEATAA